MVNYTLVKKLGGDCVEMKAIPKSKVRHYIKKYKGSLKPRRVIDCDTGYRQIVFKDYCNIESINMWI